jgi:hypothetical protein
VDDDHWEQSDNLFRQMTPTQKEVLIGNTAHDPLQSGPPDTGACGLIRRIVQASQRHSVFPLASSRGARETGRNAVRPARKSHLSRQVPVGRGTIAEIRGKLWTFVFGTAMS